jgi:hypothetical protein
MLLYKAEQFEVNETTVFWSTLMTFTYSSKIFLYNPSLFSICTKYNKQMGGNRNKRGGGELSSAHPYVGGARPGMVSGSKI